MPIVTADDGSYVEPLKILIVLHMPWLRELGAPRVSIETAEELTALGHKVDKYDILDALPGKSKILGIFKDFLFPFYAIAYVRRYGSRYDVIQAEQGNLPIPKRWLRFKGVLVARSNGLVHFYEEFHRSAVNRVKNPNEPRGTLFGNILRAIANFLSAHELRAKRSYSAADAVVVLNDDEKAYLSSAFGLGSKTFVVPNGLTVERMTALSSSAATARDRILSRTVVFVGHWGPRKGARDFPSLVRTIKEAVPDTKFLLIGTGSSAEEVLQNFDSDHVPDITVIARFDPPDLPKLLAKATVGVLPSYIEGFGIGILEQLASGIPTVAYDVPGPRCMLNLSPRPSMVPAGDISGMASKVVELLRMDVDKYSAVAEEARTIASNFPWENQVANLLGIYQSNLKALSAKR